MCTFTLAAASVQAFGKVSQARAASKQDRYNATVADQNADLSLLQAEDAEKRGDIEAARALRKGKVLAATQQATVAANNLSVTSDSALDLFDDTETLAEIDAMNIRSNAEREAFKFKVQAQNQRSEAGGLRASARDKKRAGILGGVNSLFGAAAKT